MKSVLVKLAGTNGSGKSTVARTILRMYEATPWMTESRRSGERTLINRMYTPVGELLILGSYATPCGGCDGVQPYARLSDLLTLCAAKKPQAHVLMEGLLIAGYGSIGRLLETLPYRAIFATMGTPLEVCKARVTHRRAARGQPPLTDLSNLEAKFRSCAVSHDRMTAQGVATALIDCEHPVRDLLRLYGIKLAREPHHD